jgi:hypothetical protein
LVQLWVRRTESRILGFLPVRIVAVRILPVHMRVVVVVVLGEGVHIQVPVAYTQEGESPPHW